MAKPTGMGSGRRGFFRDAMIKMVSPVAGYIEGRFDLGVPQVRLRPPGAIRESLLVEACIRCGKCVEACPADAIFPLGKVAGEAVGTPGIDPDRSPCVVCEGLQCTHVCPSGALLPIDRPAMIRMGVAEVYGSLCVRRGGEACTVCVDQCPLGDAAIGFAGDGPPMVVVDGCVGCGVCQHYCPTDPKAITVVPLP